MSKTGEATVQIKRDAKFRFFDTLSWRSLDQPYQPAREMGSEAHRMSEKHVAGLSHRNIPVEVNLWQLFYPMGSRLFFCRDLLKTILQNGGAMLKCRGWCWSGTFQCLRSLSLKDFPILKGENYSWYLKNLSFPSLVWIFPLPRISEGPSHVTDWIIELGQPYSKLLNHRRVLSLTIAFFPFISLLVGTFLIFPYIGNNHPNWRTHIFQRGRYTTNQINIINIPMRNPYDRWLNQVRSSQFSTFAETRPCPQTWPKPWQSPPTRSTPRCGNPNEWTMDGSFSRLI